MKNQWKNQLEKKVNTFRQAASTFNKFKHSIVDGAGNRSVYPYRYLVDVIFSSPASYYHLVHMF